MSDLNLCTHRNWDHPDVNKYEETIALKIPGYHLLYDMLDHLLTAQWGERLSAHILVVGAGGGQEIVTLGGKHKSWKFTGVDPSERMLDIASQRIKLAELEGQVSLHHGELHELTSDNFYDAATCLLVHHFIKGIEEKKQLIQDIANRLQDGAPLFIAAINGDVTKESWSIQMNAWRSHMLANGIPTEEWERFESSIGVTSHPIPAVELEALLLDVGFSNVTRYFGSYLVDGWFAIKNGSVTS